MLVLGAFVLSAPQRASSFTLIGTSLDADEIGFQVNALSFLDTSANNNTNTDANFPGATGAALAMWKAAVEWNSELRGNTGTGDPHQPTGLGSGNSNFDFMYHGVTAQPGAGSGGVVRSSSSTLGAGVYAVTTPSNSGWSIRFDDSTTNNWNWQDGPGDETSNSQNRVDIQGIGCHELGHALGLSHSGDGGATMVPAVSQSGSIGIRSINNDDGNGVRSIYGNKSNSKPKITSITGSFVVGGTLTINGTNFSSTDNEVWFTKKTNGAVSPTPMKPVKVTGLNSTNGGTKITVAIPTGVMTGDVIVHSSGPSSDHALKSAPFPFPFVPPPPQPPVLTSLSSTVVAAMSVPIGSLTIFGTDLSNATSVTIGSKTYLPGEFDQSGESAVVVTFVPPAVEVGANLQVRVTTALGMSNALFVTITPPSQHALLVSDAAPAPGSTIEFYLGAPSAGLTPLLSYSSCFSSVDLSPYLVSAIGGCGDWIFFSPLPAPTDARGLSTYPITLPAAFTGVGFFQAWFIDLSQPTFPLPPTNLITVTVQ